MAAPAGLSARMIGGHGKPDLSMVGKYLDMARNVLYLTRLCWVQFSEVFYGSQFAWHECLFGRRQNVMQGFVRGIVVKLCGFLAVVFVFTHGVAYAFDVTLAWDAKTESDLSGYKVYYGTASRTYGTPVNAGKNTTYTITGLNGGTYYFSVTAYYSSGFETGYSNEVTKTFAVVDTAPPVLSSIQSSSIASDGATVTWSSSEVSTSQIDFGTSTAYGSTTALDSTLVTSHIVVLSGLASATSYNYRVRSSDAAGNVAVSANFTFTTMPDPKLPAPSNIIVK